MQPLELIDADLTRQLRAWREGDEAMREELVEAIRPSLRRIAAQQLARRRGHVSIRVTELVNEWFIRASRSEQPAWENRDHFYGITARLMRHILVDHCRRKSSLKRGGSGTPVSLNTIGGDVAGEFPSIDLVALDEALTLLAEVDDSAARVVELRFFGDLTLDEIAKVMDLGRATVVRRWRYARAWLRRRLEHRCPKPTTAECGSSSNKP